LRPIDRGGGSQGAGERRGPLMGPPIKRVREACPDLLGDNGWRWRVLRTSNAYTFTDPSPAADRPFRAERGAVRRGIAVQSDRPGSIVLAFDRLPKKRLGGRAIALGAQPEVNRPPRPIYGTIEIAPFASNFGVCLVHPP
jgi:hypothetical protein